MGRREKKIVWTLDAENSGMKKRLDEVDQKLDKASKKSSGFKGAWTKSFTTVAASVGVAILAVRKFIAIAFEYIGLSDKQIAAETKVSQAIKSTGQAAGFTADELNKVASELQQVSAIGDEDILKSVTAQLLTFTNITEDNFLKTQETVLDVATVLAKDLLPTTGELKAVSLQLGKALNDPVANLSALSRSGIQFSKDQKEMIKELANTNRLAEAQALILEELQRQYGGQAKAVADSVGQIKKAENAYGDLKESIGFLIKRAINPLADGFKELAEDVNDFIKISPADKIKDERLELNTLVTAIRNTNEDQKTRNTLIDNLQSKYPDFLGNLDDEAVTNEILAKKIAIANDELLKRIILQETLDEKTEIIKDGADAWNDQFEAGNKLSEQISELGLRWGVAIEEIEGVENQIIALEIAMRKTSDFIGGDGVMQISKLRGKYYNFIEAGKDLADVEKELAVKEDELAKKRKLLFGDTEKAEDATIKLAAGYKDLLEVEDEYIDSLDKEIDAQRRLIEERQKAERIANSKVIQEKFTKDIDERIKKYNEEVEASKKSVDDIITEEQLKVDLFNDLGRISNEAYLQILEERLQYAKDFYGKDSVEHLKAIQDKKQAEEGLTKNTQEIFAALSAAYKELGSQSLEGLDQFGDAALETTRKVISAYIAEGVAGAVKNALADAPFPFNLVAAPLAGAAASALFNELIPSFRTGVDDLKGGTVADIHKDERVFLPGGSTVKTSTQASRLDQEAAKQTELLKQVLGAIKNMPVPSFKIGAWEAHKIVSLSTKQLMGKRR